MTSSGLGEDELVTVTISNNGLNEMSDFDIELMFNGLPLETITISETIEPFNESAFQFSAPIDLSNNGDYDITVNISHRMMCMKMIRLLLQLVIFSSLTGFRDRRFKSFMR